jgi:uncharacterized Zn-finger protein
MAETRSTPTVTVHADDLPVYCPHPGMPLWSSHPRVYLDVAGARGSILLCDAAQWPALASPSRR